MVVHQSTTLDSEEAVPDTNTAFSAPAHSHPGLQTTSLPCHPRQEGTLPTANTSLHHANCKVPRDPVLDSPTRTHSCSRYSCQGWCKVLRRIYRWLQACTLCMRTHEQAVGQQQGTKALPLVRLDITRNRAGQIAVQARSRALRSSALHRRALLLTKAAFCPQTRTSAAGTRGRGSLKHRAPVADANTVMRRVGGQLAPLPASRSPSAERRLAPRARARLTWAAAGRSGSRPCARATCRCRRGGSWRARTAAGAALRPPPAPARARAAARRAARHDPGRARCARRAAHRDTGSLAHRRPPQGTADGRVSRRTTERSCATAPIRAWRQMRHVCR